MTTNVIDINIHGSSFPATYTGSGDTIGNPVLTVAGVSRVSGYFTGKGNAVNIPVGFQPTYVCVADETNVIIWEWYRGQASTHAWKTVTAGTKTVDMGLDGGQLVRSGERVRELIVARRAGFLISLTP